MKHLLSLCLALVSAFAFAEGLVPSKLNEADRAKLAKIAAVRPDKRQLTWQRYELTAFFHYGINTYTKREWGTGKESPELFNPPTLDCRQWIRSVKAAGFKLAILTAKHHDGFCLWPSKLTKHSVASSPWKNGKGDVCREFANACRAEGIKVGFYLSPWDRHEPSYGTPEYNDFFVGQLNELFDNYGPIDEIWFDGACGEGPNGKRQVYDWARFYATIRKRNPNCVIAVSGPDVRWVGNESGFARESEWSVLPTSSIDNKAVEKGFEAYHFDDKDMALKALSTEQGFNAQAPTLGALENVLAADAWVWYPAECDVSIRRWWFSSGKPDNWLKTLPQLMDIYLRSVGHNAVLLLNVPPTASGKLDADDVALLKQFGQVLRKTFGRNLLGKVKPGQTAFKPIKPITFDTVVVQENIAFGQLVERFRVEIQEPGSEAWKTIATATTIGHKRIIRLPKSETAGALRVVIEETRGEPHILKVGAYRMAM